MNVVCLLHNDMLYFGVLLKHKLNVKTENKSVICLRAAVAIDEQNKRSASSDVNTSRFNRFTIIFTYEIMDFYKGLSQSKLPDNCHRPTIVVTTGHF